MPDDELCPDGPEPDDGYSTPLPPAPVPAGVTPPPGQPITVGTGPSAPLPETPPVAPASPGEPGEPGVPSDEEQVAAILVDCAQTAMAIEANLRAQINGCLASCRGREADIRNCIHGALYDTWVQAQKALECIHRETYANVQSVLAEVAEQIPALGFTSPSLAQLGSGVAPLPSVVQGGLQPGFEPVPPTAPVVPSPGPAGEEPIPPLPRPVPPPPPREFPPECIPYDPVTSAEAVAVNLYSCMHEVAAKVFGTNMHVDNVLSNLASEGGFALAPDVAPFTDPR